MSKIHSIYSSKNDNDILEAEARLEKVRIQSETQNLLLQKVSIEAEVKTLDSKKEMLKRKVAKTRDQLESDQLELDEINLSKEAAKMTLDDFEKNKRVEAEKIEKLCSKRDELQKEIEKVEEDNAQKILQFEVKRKEYEDQLDELGLLIKDQEIAGEMTTEKVRLEKAKISNELQDMEKQKGELIGQIQNNEEIWQKKEHFLRDYKGELDELKVSILEKRKILASFSEEATQEEVRKDELSQQVIDFEKKKESLTKQLAKLRSVKNETEQGIIKRKEEASEGLKEELNQLDQQALDNKRELENLVEEKNKVDLTKKEVLSEIDEMKLEKVKIEEEIENLQNTRQQGLADIERQKQQAMLEVEELSDDAKGARIARQNAERALEQLKEAQEKENKLRHEINSFEITKSKQDNIIAKMKLEAQQELKEVREKQRAEIEREKANVLKMADERAKKEYQDQLDIIERKLKEDKRKAEVEYKKKCADDERRFANKKAQEIDNITTGVSEAVVYKIKDILKKKDRQKHLDELMNNIHGLVYSSLNKEGPSSNEKLKDMMSFSQTRVEKNKRYYFKVVVASVVFVMLLIIHLTTPVTRNIRIAIVNMLRTDKSASDMFIENVKDKRATDSLYEPEQTSDYKDSYTHNILFTLDYLDAVQEEEYKNEWVVSLNAFLINKLELSDNSIVDFMSIETNLMEQLVHIRSSITPMTEEKSIQKMENIEAAATEDIVKLMQSDKNYNEFKQFQQKFYQDYLSQQE
ncbi:MAG: hypothetical protein ISR65_08980 [Bacteriovoracaceae bacterium]|nr:hypothetical protein [Bacteriovoracaceae bacterium]